MSACGPSELGRRRAASERGCPASADNRPVLDVRPEDLRAATAALQRLALALFEELFDGGPGLTAERWFASPDARVLDRIPFTRLGWRRLVARAAPFLRDAVTDRKRWAAVRRRTGCGGRATRFAPGWRSTPTAPKGC